MIFYLHNIATTWGRILDCGDVIVPQSVVDSSTVEKLEFLAPGSSMVDKDLIHDFIVTREIFPSVTDDGLRRRLESNLMAVPGAIPSLFTFFETLKYVEPICEVFKRLLGSRLKRTIRSSMMSHYFPPGKIMVQATETSDLHLAEVNDKKHGAFISYMELWAFCGRYFDGLTTWTPKKELREAKPLVKGPNPVLWQHFAKLVLDRGFQIEYAKELAEGDSQSQLAIEYLRKANPATKGFASEHVQRVVEACLTQPDQFSDILDADDQYIAKDRRGGRPYERDHAKDKTILFLPYVCCNQTSEEFTMRTLRSDMFRQIFGSIIVSVPIQATLLSDFADAWEGPWIKLRHYPWK